MVLKSIMSATDLVPLGTLPIPSWNWDHGFVCVSVYLGIVYDIKPEISLGRMPRANIEEQNSGVGVLHWIYAPWASIHGLSRKKTERALMSPPLHPAEVKTQERKTLPFRNCFFSFRKLMTHTTLCQYITRRLRSSFVEYYVQQKHTPHSGAVEQFKEKQTYMKHCNSMNRHYHHLAHLSVA